MTLKGVQKHFKNKSIPANNGKQTLTDNDVRRILRDEMEAQNRFVNDFDPHFQ